MAFLTEIINRHKFGRLRRHWTEEIKMEEQDGANKTTVRPRPHLSMMSQEVSRRLLILKAPVPSEHQFCSNNFFL